MSVGQFERLLFFFFNDTATTEIYTLSLHDALPILFGEKNELYVWCSDATVLCVGLVKLEGRKPVKASDFASGARLDRKSTRLNSSHGYISYAGFCLEKKKNV